MTEVGKISVKAELNTADFDRGTTKVKANLDEVKAKSKSAENDFGRMGSSIGALGGKLMAMGTAGIFGLGAIASGSPALAGSMTKIKIATDQLFRSIGEDLAPTFAWLAEKYQDFVSFIDEHPLITKVAFNTSLIMGVIGTFALLTGAVKGTLTQLAWMKTGFMTLNAWKGAGVLSTFGKIGKAVGIVGLAILAWKAPEWIRTFTDAIGLTDPKDPSLKQDIIRGTTNILSSTLLLGTAGFLTAGIPGAIVAGSVGFGIGVYKTIQENAQIEAQYGEGNNQKIINGDYGSPSVHLPPQIKINLQSPSIDPHFINRTNYESNSTDTS